MALLPWNDLTEELEKFFFPYDYPIIYFESEQEMSDYILDDDYLDKDSNGIPKQLCMAIQIDKYDTIND